MSTLKEKIAIDNAKRFIGKTYIRNTDLDLVEKFWFVNRTLFAINLGLCGFEPRVAYDILKMERVGKSRILISYKSKGKELLYLLPERYANIISDRDIAQINSKIKKTKLLEPSKSVMRHDCTTIINRTHGI